MNIHIIFILFIFANSYTFNLNAQNVLQATVCIKSLGPVGAIEYQYSLTLTTPLTYKQPAIKKIRQPYFGVTDYYTITELSDTEIRIDFSFAGDDPHVAGGIGLEKREKALFEEELVLYLIFDGEEEIVTISDIEELPCMPGR